MQPIDHATMEKINIDPIWLPKKLEYSYEQECEDILGEIVVKENQTRQTLFYGICQREINYTFINNATKINETKKGQQNYSCITGQEYSTVEVQTGTIIGVVWQKCRNIGITSKGKSFYWKNYGYSCCFVSDENILCEKEHQSNGDCAYQSGEGIEKKDANFRTIESTISQTSKFRNEKSKEKNEGFA